MDKFWYLIEAETESTAIYIRHLLRSYGLVYPWEVKGTSSGKGNTIRIITGKEHEQNKFPCSETILTTHRDVLTNLGLELEQDHKLYQLGYLFPVGTLQNTPSYAIPFPLTYACPLVSNGIGWIENCFLIGSNSIRSLVSFSRIVEDMQQTIIAVDLLGFLDEAMLGPTIHLGEGNEGWEDWSVPYSQISTQSLAYMCNVDQVLSLLRDLLVKSYWDALPIKVDYYPPGKSAPLIITGDSDDATPFQLDSYLRTLEEHGVRASLILKRFDLYSKEQLASAQSKGHCFGIHPYAETGKLEEFKSNFVDLINNHQMVFHEPAFGVRNHRFQWVGRTASVELEQNFEVLFDLNCVAACESWCGSGSGVGYPISFPPRDEKFSIYPLQLPTIVEDDVFLYSYDYCYKSFINGDHLPVEAVLHFLNEWVITNRHPATVNLHPEHVTPTTRMLLDSILEWKERADIWTPTLKAWGNWIQDRDECNIVIIQRPEGLMAHVSSSLPIVFQVNSPGSHNLIKSEKREITVVGKMTWYLD